MFRSKRDVDRHVKDIFIKLKSPEEKHLRCYNIAKLYYQVGDYESAKKYVATYLEIRDKCAGAYKLLGQTLEALGQKEAAFMEYKRSLELEPKQDDLVLKVCELLTDININIDVERIKYCIERADEKFPHNPIVFQLKEKMLTLEKSSGSNEDLEKLITSELSVRKTDVHLKVKLLKHYLRNHRLEDAYNHAIKVEATHSHRNSIIWYQSLSELLKECKQSKESDWTFWIFYINVLERYAALCLKEQANPIKKSISDATQAVFNFDQCLTEFESENFPNHAVFIENILSHMWGQLHFHLACLFLRKTKAERDSWAEAGRICAPVLLTALHVMPPDLTALWTMLLKNPLQNQVRVWYREGYYRRSQAGHVLQDFARDNTEKLMDKIGKFYTNLWHERVYQRIFDGGPYRDGKSTSFFVKSSFPNPPLRLFSYNELKRFDEISEEVWPDSLHHQVWLGLRFQSQSLQNKECGPLPNQTSHVFCDLQFSVFSLNQASPDSLSRLDIDAFLNAAIFCACAVMEDQHLTQQLRGFSYPETLPTLPADLTNTLCTYAQEKWWSAAYKIYAMDKQKLFDEDLGDIRLELQRGLEVVRCIGNHGLHPALLVHLARIFHYRAEILRESNQTNIEIPSLEARSELYWSTAIPLLKRLQNNQVLCVTDSKFFNYQGRKMNNAELAKALEEGKLFLAHRFVQDKQYEKAIEELQTLKCPEASFQLGQMYEMLAEEIVDSMPKESLTSELRSQHIIILSKAREFFYLTLDRLRSPGTNPKHPLNSELSGRIADIESKLKRIDPDLYRGDFSRNEYDRLSDDSYSSAHSGLEQPVVNTTLTTITELCASSNTDCTPQKNHQRTPKQSSTPYRAQHYNILDLSRNRREARPSPERLDAQIRAITQMIHTKDSMMQSITEQNKSILDINKTVMMKIEELTKEMAELRKDVQRLRTSQPMNLNPNLEEDLCGLSEEDFNELNYNANPSGPVSSISGNMFPSSHRNPYSQLIYPSAAATATAFQGYFPGGMSFGDPNAASFCTNIYPMPVLYPNTTRSKMPDNILQQGLFPPRLPAQMLDLMPTTNQPPMPMSLQKVETPKPETTIKDAPVNKVPPVNVVITTSDTLPTTVPVAQPTLSVTIPPHFRQGGVSTLATAEQPVAPHCYQISMPSQATVLTTVNLPPLSTTLTTTPANITMPTTPKASENANICSTGSPNVSDQEHESEHDPIPDFVPVIPLPAEVKVTTGEEGQEVLFCARAKLFRFVDNEWKERGIGNVKLLRNDEGKVRLLMRREQVLKVCANHYLAPDMELTAKANNEKAWFWVAHDFADGELKLEKFCIKFKTVDEGLSFKEKFDKAKASLSQVADKSAENKTAAKTDVVLNNVEKKEVKEPKGTALIGQKQPAATVPQTSSMTTVVGGFSFTTTPIIQKVTTPVEPVKTPSKPENSPFAGFTFSKTVTTTESPTPSTFSFTKAATPKSETTTVPTVATDTVTTTSSQSTLQRPHGPPTSVTTKMVGVMNKDAKINHEDILFEAKVSLQYYNNDTKQWEQRGTGQMKTLWSTKTDKMRLLMTEENSSKVCYNYNVQAKSPFTLKSNNNVVNWVIHSGSEKAATFAATFKTSGQASQFHTMIVSNQQKMVKDSVSVENMKKKESAENTTTVKAQAPLSEMFKPPIGSWECTACYTRNEASSSECIACKSANPAASKSTVPGTANTNQTPLSEMFKPPMGSWECKDCYTVNGAFNSTCIACKAANSSATSNQTAPTATPTNQVPLSEMFKPRKVFWVCADCDTRNESSSSECVACKTANPFVSKQPPLSEMFKPPVGSWECKDCYTVNGAFNSTCIACKAVNSSATSNQTAPTVTPANQTTLSEMFEPPTVFWMCADCYTRNEPSSSECVACKSANPAASKQTVPGTANTNQTPLSEMFKPPVGSWECKDCYTVNGAFNSTCIACKAANSSATSNQTAPTATPTNQIPLSEMLKPLVGSWECQTCEIVNTSRNNYCVVCDKPKDPSIPPKPKTDDFIINAPATTATPTFTFGIPQNTKTDAVEFNFRLPVPNEASDTKSSEVETEVDTSGAKFVFGMPQASSAPTGKDAGFAFDSPGKSFGFNFVAKSPSKATVDGENSEEEVVESDDIHFSPIIPMPDKIEVKTGEEDEEVLYCHRAKLFRRDKTVNEWKERGLGDIKLLRHKKTGKLRLVMRREQILKLCLNHLVTPSLELKPKDEKSWMWIAADYSEGEIEPTLFACRFKTAEIAKDFKNTVEDALAEKDVPVIEEKPEATSDAKDKGQEVEVVYEMKVTPEEREAALKLQLPENFYAYKRKADCPGCRGCKEPPVPLFETVSAGKVSSKTATESEKSTSVAVTSTDSNFTVSQTIASTTDTTSTTSSVFMTGLSGASTPQFSMNSMSPFGSSNATVSTDKKTTFSFGLSQNQTCETPKPEGEKKNVFDIDNLSICSPTEPQATSEASSLFSGAATSTGSTFGTPKSDSIFGISTGKNMFGGSSKKESGFIKPSTFSVSSEGQESIFSNSFTSQSKPTNVSATSVFGATTPIFGAAAKTGPEMTTSTTSLFSTPTTTTTVFGSAAKPTHSIFGSNLNFGSTESPFGFSNPTTLKNEPQKESGITFLAAPEVTFSDLAANVSVQAFRKDPNFSFAGTGTTVFGSKSTNKSEKTKEADSEKRTETEEKEGDENENEQEHDPQFEPIVPLPDIIEVRTGEEDEEKVFCERAKLYRFDRTAGEWKERGVGEMKILHNVELGTYRLLMRREQVHKVVCNFLITPNIKFSKSTMSDCVVTWAGINHAEEERAEQLALKLKNVELATKFMDTIGKVQQILTEIRKEDESVET